MEKDWVVIYISSDQYQVQIAKNLLDENKIETVIINKQDSMYPSNNAGIELYTHQSNFNKAKEILLNANL
jgi:hypothetical protein